MALNFPPSDQSPFIAPNGVVYVWNENGADQGYWETQGSSFLPLAGGNLTGAVTANEIAITAGGWDLSEGNFFSCGAVAIPTPSNGVNGQSGLIRFTDVPTSFPAETILPADFNIAAPCVAPFYVQAADRILLGNPVEVS